MHRAFVQCGQDCRLLSWLWPIADALWDIMFQARGELVCTVGRNSWLWDGRFTRTLTSILQHICVDTTTPLFSSTLTSPPKPLYLSFTGIIMILHSAVTRTIEGGGGQGLVYLILWQSDIMFKFEHFDFTTPHCTCIHQGGRSVTEGGAWKLKEGAAHALMLQLKPCCR